MQRDCVAVPFNLVIPEPQHPVAVRLEVAIAFKIQLALAVLPAIGFNDQFLLMTDKIDNIGAIGS